MRISEKGGSALLLVVRKILSRHLVGFFIKKIDAIRGWHVHNYNIVFVFLL